MRLYEIGVVEVVLFRFARLEVRHAHPEFLLAPFRSIPVGPSLRSPGVLTSTQLDIAAHYPWKFAPPRLISHPIILAADAAPFLCWIPLRPQGA